MKPYKRKEVIGNATLYLGDCLELLSTFDKVDFIYADPPYGLGEKWKYSKKTSLFDEFK